jgi:membrane fusion protein (multidrug efflux system)
MAVEFIGQLDSPQNVEVRARVEAFVDKFFFTEGTEVKEGDPLFKLDDKPVQQRLAAAKASLAESKAALNKYDKDVARLTPLATKKAVPQQDLDNALASVDVGKASVLSAEARVQQAELELSYCDVRAPVSGLIGAKQVAMGDLVGKSEPTLLATHLNARPHLVLLQHQRSELPEGPGRNSPYRQESPGPACFLIARGRINPS